MAARDHRPYGAGDRLTVTAAGRRPLQREMNRLRADLLATLGTSATVFVAVYVFLALL